MNANKIFWNYFEAALDFHTYRWVILIIVNYIIHLIGLGLENTNTDTIKYNKFKKANNLLNLTTLK